MTGEPRHPIRQAYEQAETYVPDAQESQPGRQTKAKQKPPASTVHKGRDGLPPIALAPGGPVTPLGHRQGRFFYLDGAHQLRELGEKDHGQGGLDSLFAADPGWMREHYSRVNENGKVTGFRGDLLRQSLMNACDSMGIFSPEERVRGRGCWIGDGGRLIVHRGDAILDGKQWRKPGVIDAHLYLADAPISRPPDAPQDAGDKGPAGEILALLRSWTWLRGDLDCRLMLGWIGAAMLGGALPWRPAVWVSGGRGTGKSTLHRLISFLMARGLIATADATPAGIWQELQNQSLPVIIDELEPGENMTATSGIVRLARLAASGGEILRGGADHKASRFTARACFLFSSILVPPLTPQDQSRIVMLKLGEVRSATPIAIDPGAIGDLGLRLLRRLIDHWPRFPQALEAFRFAVQAEGGTARAADVLGTLLAISELALSDLPVHTDTAQTVAMSLLNSTDQADDGGRDEEQCLSHLMTVAVPLTGTSRKPVADWIAEAFGALYYETGEESANVLAACGMKLGQREGQHYLVIASTHDALRKIFEGTPWGSRPGAAGGWMQSLGRLPGATKPTSGGKTRIGRGRGAIPVRAAMVPLSLILTSETLSSRITLATHNDD